MYKKIMSEENRLDIIVSQIANISRSKANKLIKDQKCLIGKTIINKPSYIVKVGEELIIQDECLNNDSVELIKEDIPINVIYEDEHFAIINKQYGLVVHPGHGIPNGTLVNGLLYHFNNLSDCGGKDRPGIVHRIDKDTSGLLIIAKTNESYYKLVDMIANKEIKKYYICINHGIFKNKVDYIKTGIARNKNDRTKMCVDTNGKPAETRYLVLKEFSNYSLLLVRIITGRTHQIRVHMKYKGHPILGDPIYGNSTSFKNTRLLLHSYGLEFLHPFTSIPLKIYCKPEGEFLNFLNKQNIDIDDILKEKDNYFKILDKEN